MSVETRRASQAAWRAANPGYSAAWCASNPEKVKVTKAKFYAANKEKVKAYHAANPEQVKTTKAKYRAANKEKEKAYSAEHRSRPEVRAQIAAQKRKRYASDTSFKLASLLRDRLRCALKNKSKRGSAVNLLGCTVEEAIAHIESLFAPGMAWENWGLFGWHIDHIQPLRSFDLADPAQLAVACHYSNLQPLWANDNLSKGSRAAA